MALSSVINGFVVKEKMGYIHRVGTVQGAYGFFDTLKGCIEKSMRMGYEFFNDQSGTHKKILLEKCTDTTIHHSDVGKDALIFVACEGDDEIVINLLRM